MSVRFDQTLIIALWSRMERSCLLLLIFERIRNSFGSRPSFCGSFWETPGASPRTDVSPVDMWLDASWAVWRNAQRASTSPAAPLPRDGDENTRRVWSELAGDPQRGVGPSRLSNSQTAGSLRFGCGLYVYISAGRWQDSDLTRRENLELLPGSRPLNPPTLWNSADGLFTWKLSVSSSQVSLITHKLWYAQPLSAFILV